MRETYGTSAAMRDVDEEWEVEARRENYLKMRAKERIETERLKAEKAPESPFVEDDGA